MVITNERKSTVNIILRVYNRVTNCTPFGSTAPYFDALYPRKICTFEVHFLYPIMTFSYIRLYTMNRSSFCLQIKHIFCYNYYCVLCKNEKYGITSSKHFRSRWFHGVVVSNSWWGCTANSRHNQRFLTNYRNKVVTTERSHHYN